MSGTRRRGLSNAPLIEIPEWALQSVRGGAYTLASALVLTDFENRWIRIPVSLQRKILGFAVFGKHVVHFDGAVFRVHHSSVGGSYTDTLHPSEIDRMARERIAA